MAEAVLITIGTSLASGFLKSLMQKSVNVLSESSFAGGFKFALLGNLESQLADLKPELEKLDALLRSAPVHLNGNGILLPWLNRVKAAANFADNLLDDISYEQTRRQAESNAVPNLLLCGSDGSLAFRIKLGRKLSKFMSMIDEIYNQGLKIGLRPVELVANPSSYQPPAAAAMSADLREIRENADTSLVVGREADEELIVGELCRPNNEQVLGVIAIVGMSGVGKTTLARKIYDNEIVTKQYKNKIWIFVSDDFNLRRFLDEMLQSLTGDNHNLLNTDAMEKKLKNCLQKESYLLVLDDVWNTNKQVWDSIRTSLLRVADGCTGTSMVLVTTQLKEVASVMGASLTRGVEILSKDDSWELFEGKAFANKSPKQVSNLRDIGERILNKCGGLPLAINTLASLLATMNDRSQWESVDRSQVWLLESQTNIMPWLLLSFNHLSEVKCPAIKQCFAHCSVLFSKGKHLSDRYLISSWIAQGFIQLAETSDQDYMAIGRLYIESMLAHGFLQIHSHNVFGQRFTMHDLIHHLAVYVSGDRYLTIMEHNDLRKNSSEVEHASMIYGGKTFNSQLDFPKGNAQNSLRTLICSNPAVSIELVGQARFLRHLELRDCGLKEIPRSIGRLKHLRILSLDNNLMKYLPESISNLYNLQVLTLLQCHRLVELPQEVTKLLNLRWIETTTAVHIPKGLGQLTHLNYLPTFKLKVGDGCKIKELGSLKHLMGVIMIKQLENISSKEEVVGAGLKNKAGIEAVKLEWSSEGNEGDIIGTNDEEVMEGLQPHSNLKSLWVRNFHGKRFSLWLSSGIYCINLTHLALLSCKRCEQLPTLGCLPCLKLLYIDGMESVEVIGSDFFGCSSTGSSHNDTNQCNLFPCLQVFQLENMPKVKEWFDPSGKCASVFSCLEKLWISNCPLLVSVPSCFHSLQDLRIGGINSGQPLLMILSNSYKLTSLWVEHVQQLTCLSEPLLKCTSLRRLLIKGCNELVELPPTLQSLGCLETLSVENCNSLTSLPDTEGLLSLRNLTFRGCQQIANTDMAISSQLRYMNFYYLSKQLSVPQWLNHISNLTGMTIGGFNRELDIFRGIEHLPKSLKSLYLIGWPKLKSLPDEVQSLTQLETLHLCEFDEVTALPEWLGNISSLRSLKIWNCKNAKHLPSLDAMRMLTQLGELVIEQCPLLEERCRKEGGEEWHKISHILRIQINDVKSSELVQQAKEEVESALRVTIGTSLASGFLKSVMQKAANVLSKSAVLGNLESQLAHLKQELEKLDALVCSAERLNPAHHNRSALLLQWLGGIKKAANFAEILLDDISYEQIRRQTECNMVSNLSLPSSIGSLGFRIQIGRKLNKCMSMIAKIYKEAAKIGLKPVELVENLSENVDISGVVGREADEELIVRELCRPNNDQLLGVIAIVGRPGVGKTTLARKIYHNETVTEQYKNKVWISMTEYFNTDALEKKLKSCLEKGRFLVVLDNVWIVNRQVFDSIKTVLVQVANGCTGSSMVLVTTQLQDVASLMGACLTHGLKILSKYDSRVLFQRKAFANKSQEQVSDMRDVGERILNKCGGFPSAINTLASLLANMNERSQWESVDRSQVWNLLSFNLLPSAAIKRCFAHCSILIPKGEAVPEEFLISSWFAQGFIQLPETSDQDLWTIGQMYIKSMLGLGLLQLHCSDNGSNVRFTMHDHMHDLAVYVSGDEYLTIREPDDLHKASSGVEHLLIHGGNTFNSQLNFLKGNAQSTLRTLICHHATTVSIDLVAQARFLRQLELIDCGLKEIPRSIERLKHLRRVCIKDNPIKYLPDSIGSLYNLQALRLLGCHRSSELPQQVTKLLNLREIYTGETVHIPKGLGQLTRLTLVPPFKLKAGDGCRIKELGSLKQLNGALMIEQLENISSKEDVVGAGLKNIAGIEAMNLRWSSKGNEGDIIGTNDEEVMEGLQPHSNLKQLWVENFRGKRLSLWLSSGLYCINLTHLTLRNCKRCEQLPTLGCLPCLKNLFIDGMESVEVIGSDFFSCSSTGSSHNDTSQCNLFPCLEEFQLLNMPNLKEWFDPSGSCGSAFPCLEKLKISNCPLLVSVPSCFHSLQDLHFEGINSGQPLLMILSNSYKLTSLWVKNVQQFSCLSEPLLKCTSLQRLRITGCKELVELLPTLESMGCLETLRIKNCDSLTSLPCIEGLLSLKDLDISECEQITDLPSGLESCVSIEGLFVNSCPKLNFNLDLAILSRLRRVSFCYLSKQMSVMPWLNQLSNLTKVHIGGFNNELDNICGIEHLPKSLKSLNLIGWPKLKSLPDELQSLSQLENLALWRFDGVTVLPEWLGSLSFLQSLQIGNCIYMKHMPSLDAMRRLTRLGELVIRGCPLLEESCRKEGGEEWHKISHIPLIRINEAEA